MVGRNRSVPCHVVDSELQPRLTGRGSGKSRFYFIFDREVAGRVWDLNLMINWHKSRQRYSGKGTQWSRYRGV